MNTRIALVLGATGGIGGEFASRLASGGWQVSALHRDPARAGKEDRLQWIKGDAMVAADVAKDPAADTDENGEKHRFVCKVCGYVYEGGALPEDYKCPLCGAGAEYFRQEA